MSQKPRAKNHIPPALLTNCLIEIIYLYKCIFYVGYTPSHKHITDHASTGLVSEQDSVITVFKEGSQHEQQVPKETSHKLLKIYYKEMNIIKLEKSKTFEKTGRALCDKKSGNK